MKKEKSIYENEKIKLETAVEFIDYRSIKVEVEPLTETCMHSISYEF